MIDVWSRLWPSTIVGKRSYRGTLNLFGDLSKRMSLETIPLITTDGFKFYETVIGRVFGPGCVYGQVISAQAVPYYWAAFTMHGESSKKIEPCRSF